MIRRVLLLTTSLAWASTAQAQVHVQSTGLSYGTITEAVAAASGADILTIDPGVYSEHVVLDRGVTLQGAGSGSVTIAHSGADLEVIEVFPGVTAIFVGLTIQSTDRRGINATGTNDLTLIDVVFDGTTSGAADGGGLYANNPTALSLTDVVFDGTTAANGGGLYASASTLPPVDLTDVTFLGTSASASGGGIYLDTIAFDCTGCVFDGTSALNGGAIHDQDASNITISGSTFTATSAVLDGGAIHIAGGGDVNVQGSTFCATSAGGDGGAIAGAPAFADLTNVVLNSASGGGVYATTGVWTVQNLTVAGTTGVGATFTGATTTASIVNSLFLDGSNFAINFAAGASTMGIDHNAFQGNTNGNVSGAALGVGNLEGISPQLAAWSDDGNCANDVLEPLFGSPLVDAGTGTDPDGSPADIGATGGSDADPHPDADADGYSVYRDCDDARSVVAPGRPEVCDTLDNDCNGLADDDATDVDTFYEDCDGDGQGDAATGAVECFEPTTGACAWVAESLAGPDAWSDCDDGDPSVYFGADELCLEGDQNCDGDDDLFAVDATTYYIDGDGDGFGALPVQLCSLPAGHSTTGGDCDDTVPTVHPGATDTCGDGIDQDCNGGDGDDTRILEWFPDLDGDGYGDPLALPVIDCADLSGAGYTDVTLATDCDDTTDLVSPEGTESCNLVDDDCNGIVDDVGPVVTWYEDADLDGFGNDAFPVEDDCAPGPEWIQQGGDCDDTEPGVHPDAVEICNDVDDDCDDKVDADDDDAVGLREVWPDFDGDGYGACDGDACPAERVCPDDVGGTADNPDDCNDANPAQNPGADEVPKNDIDEDCDGVALDAPRPGVDDDEDGGGGCNCDSGSSRPTWVAGLLLALALRRRS